ncbi:hybrid sensor histidine kinase/response regulator [Candidatus Albibeggiatoa sp. nov. BB20]|uniref:hybrid sensor histidine kinase/response regulator n=1 Tax=Candidatus Albibeggiatoa sp. nov. BB20 TaxID=3162723 RepID=UPI0033656313
MIQPVTKDKILIVDDIPANMWVLLEVLSDAGYDVLLAQSGEQALRVAEYAKPALILLDVMMPNMDGFEVCRILKTNPDLCKIPVIFMTALSDTINKLKGFELGAADYVTKPIQYKEVLARVSAHLEVHKLQATLVQRNAELETFSRMVAHDLKNPLNAVINLTEMVADEYEQAQEINKAKSLSRLRWVSQAGQQMMNIVDALLLMAGIAQNKKVDIDVVNMNQILDEVIQKRLLYMIDEHQAEITRPSSLPTALGYAPWIHEIWANYISNAIKYGGYPPQLQMGATPLENGMTEFWIKDNGRGLSEEEQAKLFKPFTRLHDGDGHGLGLSIVQQIAERLGGEVGVKSELKQGSRFYFTLPSLDKE